MAAVPFARAARELELKPREFELAVQLGLVRTVSAGPGGGRRRVAREEIDRHVAGPGFPEALRTRVWVVGTSEGAELMGISPARFGRLARAGCFAPVRFYVNRYRAVVWHYLATDLVDFADASPELLTGRTPAALRDALEEREDRRARGWRARRLDQLLALTDDPWERAAATASVLGPEQLADAVPDPYERARVSELRPELSAVRADTQAVRVVVERVTLAADPEEIAWYRKQLTDALARARAACPVTGPEGYAVRVTAREEPSAREARPAPEPAVGLRALWGRLRGRR
ncbi:hypothetical protein SMD11_0737 [Streptomyces albireticuli]|uniref:Uncharacterized protein n=1 Tax=Streptomyces albireticuli TaxID=1940 RepID=A0A1Z2KWI5_9ACTN|nr:hypothetical protein SMD11_0737 [Streptomyces albireticuli]